MSALLFLLPVAKLFLAMSTGTGLIMTFEDLRRGEFLASATPHVMSFDVLITSGFF